MNINDPLFRQTLVHALDAEVSSWKLVPTHLHGAMKRKLAEAIHKALESTSTKPTLSEPVDVEAMLGKQVWFDRKDVKRIVWPLLTNRAAPNQTPAPAAQGLTDAEQPRFLLVAMDDDKHGHPTFCADEAAVRAALAPCLYFFNEKYPLDADDEESIDASLAVLLEDGELRFEGDPGINLYRLAASRTTPTPGEA